ncbi:hypothetical protein MBANPS3_009425 [Mucor bainieri]
MLTKKLPIELLDFIDSAQELAQCRLVCKYLDCPAERAMFTKPIVLPSVSRVKALRYHLMKNEELGSLITHLDFKNVVDRHVHVYIDLLPLLFTSAMVSLQGYISTPGFYRALVDVAKASGTSFDNLKVLPTPSFPFPDEYYDAIFFFGKTLQHIIVSNVGITSAIPWDVYSRLGELINLTSLSISGGIDSVQDLDRMLIGCIHLEELTFWSNGTVESSMGKNGLLAWMEEAQVEQVPALRKVEVFNADQADIVEYLILKYPNIKEANLTLGESVYQEEEDIWTQVVAIEQTIDRIFGALRNIPLYRINYFKDISPLTLHGIQDRLKSYNHRLVTFIDKDQGLNTIEVQDSRRN